MTFWDLHKKKQRKAKKRKDQLGVVGNLPQNGLIFS